MSRTRVRRGWPVWIAALGVIATLAVDVSGQSYLEAYRAGLAAIDQKRWAEAVRQLQVAAGQQGDTGQSVRLYGMRNENYLPHYFLGVALYESGQLQAAIEAFNASDQAGPIKKNAAYYRRLQDLRAQAIARTTIAAASTNTIPPAPTTRPSTTTTSIAPATTTVPTPSSVPTSIVPGPAGGVEANDLRAAEQAIQRASLERQAVDRLADLDALRQIDSSLARIDRTARTDLDRAVAGLERGRRGNAADVREALTLAQSALGEFQQVGRIGQGVVKRITSDLVAATAPYFDGQYSTAKAALERLNYPPSRFAAQLRLFRAATAYALYALDNERDDRMRRQAEAEARECRRVATSLRPDPRAFSPRFIQFFSAIK